MAFEAFSSKVYRDAGGRPTVGWGHLLLPAENFAEPLTRDQATVLLTQDLQHASEGVKALTQGAVLEDYQYDALTCFAFNVGLGAFRKSTLRQKVMSDEKREAAREFLYWVYVTKEAADGTTTKVRLPGLVRRRHCESVWFLGAHPSTVTYLAGIPPEV